MKRTLGCLLTGSLVALSMPLAHAQVEEIVVSAERKDASLQEVPIAVSAFQVDDMQKLSMDLTADIGAAVPNMQTYNVTANASAMQVFMRGAGVQNPGFNASESPVGIYVDDVYRGRLATANMDLTDIERIEVLRGPQGTLYGRNTMAGAVKIVTKTPEDETWADASIGYGNFDTTKITASLGGGIAEGWGASFAAMYNKRGEGWITRGSTGGRPLGEYENRALRGKLNFFGNEVFGATLSVGYVNGENDGYNGIPYGSSNDDPGPKPDYSPAAAPGSPLEGFYDTLVPDSSAGKGDSKQLNTALDLVWDFEAVSVKSITSYSEIEDFFRFDLGGGAFQCYDDPENPFDGPCFDFGGNQVVQTEIITGVPGILVNSNSTNDTFTQEFVLQGQAFDDALDWIGGVFYMNEEGSQQYNPGVVFTGNSIVENSKTSTNSYALYAEGTWNFTDQWSATLGGRWTKDEKKFDQDCVADSATAFPFPGCVTTEQNFEDWSIDLDKSFQEFTPRAVVQYQLNEGTSFFGSYSKGFQAGGFQTLCFGFEACAQQIYDPQNVDNYELGAKTEFFDRTLRTNVALFYADYKDMQQTGILAPGFPIFPVLNVGDASVTGLELEMNWSPTESFNAFLIGAYAKDDISSEAQDNLPDSNVGSLPGLPETTLRIGGDWRAGVFGNWDFLVGADVNYVDEYYATINNALKVPSYTRVNGFIGIDQPDGNWSVVLRGKNLSDEESYVSGIAGGGTNIRTPLPPREYMLTATYKYGG